MQIYKRSTTRQSGFTLLELLVAVFISAIIAVIAYRTIAALVTTKQVITNEQRKWGNVSNVISRLNNAWDRAIPLGIRDQNGLLLPAVIGKPTLNGDYDSQLEFTLSGTIGDPEYGSTPPRRVGFRYLNGALYLVTWPELNRVPATVPEVDLLLDNLQNFTVSFLYQDGVWRDTWPLNSSDFTDFTNIPRALSITITLNSGEVIMRQWALN